MAFFGFFEPPGMRPNEITVLKPQYVLISSADGWTQRMLHKGNDGTLWVHGHSEYEWLELDPSGMVKETLPHLQQRRWRDMPAMLAQPFAVIREEA